MTFNYICDHPFAFFIYYNETVLKIYVKSVLKK